MQYSISQYFLRPDRLFWDDNFVISTDNNQLMIIDIDIFCPYTKSNRHERLDEGSCWLLVFVSYYLLLVVVVLQK